MRNLIRTLLVTSLLHLALASTGQNWSENFDSWSVQDSSYKYGYVWQGFSLVTGGSAITRQSVQSGAVGDPKAPSVLSTGFFNFAKKTYTLTFQHRTTGLSSQPRLKVVVMDTAGRQVSTPFDFEYKNSSLQTSTFTIDATAGYYRLAFVAYGQGGSSKVTFDNISSDIPVIPGTGGSAILSDIMTKVYITATSCNAQTVEIRFTNRGPATAFLYGNSGTADLSMLSGIRYSNMTMSPNLRVDTVLHKVYFFENPSATGLPVDSSVSIFFNMKVPGNCSVGMRASFTGFSGQVDMSPANSTDFAFVSLSMLPVRLESFDVKPVSGGTEVSWVAIEDNVDHYDLERDGGDGKGFTFVARMPALNGTGHSAYRVVDAASPQGKVQYRLNMVDKDGSSKYSMVRAVNTASNMAMGATRVYPNPAQSGASVSLEGLGRNEVAVSLVDMSGRTAWKGLLTPNAGKADLRLPAVPGNSLYALVIRDGSGQASQQKLYIR